MDNPFLEIIRRIDEQDVKLEKILDFFSKHIEMQSSIAEATSLIKDEKLTVQDLSKYLKMSAWTIRKLTKEGKLPYYKASKKILYNRLEVDRALSSTSKVPKK